MFVTVERPLTGKVSLALRTFMARSGLVHYLAVPLEPLFPLGYQQLVGSWKALALGSEASFGQLPRGLVALTSQDVTLQRFPQRERPFTLRAPEGVLA